MYVGLYNFISMRGWPPWNCVWFAFRRSSPVWPRSCVVYSPKTTACPWHPHSFAASDVPRLGGVAEGPSADPSWCPETGAAPGEVPQQGLKTSAFVIQGVASEVARQGEIIISGGVEVAAVVVEEEEGEVLTWTEEEEGLEEMVEIDRLSEEEMIISGLSTSGCDSSTIVHSSIVLPSSPMISSSLQSNQRKGLQQLLLMHGSPQ